MIKEWLMKRGWLPNWRLNLLYCGLLKEHNTANAKTPVNDRAEPEVESPVCPPKEVGGRKEGLEPTRYGDWEKNGRCIDF